MTGNRPEHVYLFGTCLVDLLTPAVGLNAVRLLEATGVEVHFPQSQTCCGQPAYNSGYFREARNVARQQLHAFRENWPIVVPSASCASMLHQEYPKLFDGQPEQSEAEHFARRVVELSQFLVEQGALSWPDRGPPIRVAVHHSCSAQRALHTAPYSNQLINALRQVERLEHDRPEECCGFGGTFAVKMPELSAQMARDKCQALCATGAECLIIGDSGCSLNLEGTLKHSHSRQAPRVEHLYSFLCNRYWPGTPASQIP